jgi:hypothetical protein
VKLTKDEGRAVLLGILGALGVENNPGAIEDHFEDIHEAIGSWVPDKEEPKEKGDPAIIGFMFARIGEDYPELDREVIDKVLHASLPEGQDSLRDVKTKGAAAIVIAAAKRRIEGEGPPD